MKIRNSLYISFVIIMFSCIKIEPLSGRYLSDNNLFYGLEVDTENNSIKFYVANHFSQDMSDSDFREIQNWKNPFTAHYIEEGNELIIEDLRGDILPSQLSIQVLRIELNNNSVNCSCYDLRELLIGEFGRESMCESENIVFALDN